jgi:hypothetical protein
MTRIGVSLARRKAKLAAVGKPPRFKTALELRVCRPLGVGANPIQD